jgi:hypothetical protein
MRSTFHPHEAFRRRGSRLNVVDKLYVRMKSWLRLWNLNRRFVLAVGFIEKNR